MRNKRLRSLTVLMAAAVMLLSGVSVYAADDKSGTTTVTLKVADSSAYELVIPATTTVEDFGYTKLSTNLKVSGKIHKARSVNVAIASQNSFKFVNTENARASMAYTLKASESGSDITSLSFNAEDVTTDGTPGKELGVYITQDAWNAVPGGDYSDILTFQASLGYVD